MIWKLSLPMDPLIFTFYFMVEGYNVYVTIELFPHIDVTMAESTMNSPDRDMQGPLGVNTFLNLFDHCLLDSKYNFTPTVGDNTVLLKD